MQNKCVVCGAPLPYEKQSRRMYCDVCRKRVKRQREREECKSRSSLRNDDKKPQKPKKTLSQMAKEAHDLQLTYGKYMELIAAGRVQEYCIEHGYKVPK